MRTRLGTAITRRAALLGGLSTTKGRSIEEQPDDLWRTGRCTWRGSAPRSTRFQFHPTVSYLASLWAGSAGWAFVCFCLSLFEDRWASLFPPPPPLFSLPEAARRLPFFILIAPCPCWEVLARSNQFHWNFLNQDTLPLTSKSPEKLKSAPRSRL